jgi:hypothetical protein
VFRLPVVIGCIRLLSMVCVQVYRCLSDVTSFAG